MTGRSRGAEIRFPIEDNDEQIACFTTRPDTIFGVTFLTLSPEHELCPTLCDGTDWEHVWIELRDECAKLSEFERINLLKEKKGVFLGRYALNPMSGERIPPMQGNFVVAGYGTGAVMAVPGHDERDFEFAKKSTGWRYEQSSRMDWMSMRIWSRNQPSRGMDR